MTLVHPHGMRAAWLLAFSCALGCSDSLVPHAEQFRLDVPQLRSSVVDPVSVEAPILAGTRICPLVRCGTLCDNPDLEVGHCFVQRVEGPGVLEAGCLHTTAPGEITWSFDRIPCDLDAGGYSAQSDELRLAIVAASEVAPQVEYWPERWVARAGILEGEVPVVPSPGAPLRLIEQSEVLLSTMLVHPAYPAAVVHEISAGVLRVTPTAGRPPVVLSPEPAKVRVTGFGGSRADLYFDHPAFGSALVTKLAFVPPETLVSVRIAVAYEARDGERGDPWGARAVALDGGGNPVMGVPAQWSVTKGRIGLTPGLDLPGFDYASLDGACERPPTGGVATRSATIRVDFAGHRDAHDLTWTQASSSPWSPPSDCVEPQGCQCASSPGEPPRLAWIVALVLFTRRRKGSKR